MEHVVYNNEFVGYVRKQSEKNWSYAFSWAPEVWLGSYRTKKAAENTLLHHLRTIYVGLKRIFEKEVHHGKTE